MNKHVETLLINLGDNARSQSDARSDAPAYNDRDTQTLVRAVVNGEGLRPSRSTAVEGSQQAVGTPGTSGGNRTSTSPSQRR